ncbi:T9SS type A sorting domain-containing protein [Lacinutrix sp. MEBiC02595]
MKKIYLLLFTIVTTISFGQNELTNTSFETWTGTGSTDVPTNWHGSKSSIALSAVTQSMDAQDGSSSVALSAGSSHKRFTNEAITSTNEEYTLTYYVKGNGQIRNAFHDGNYSGYTSYTSLSSATWTQMTYVFTPLAGNLEVIFSVKSTSGDGVLIDNVVLVKSATLSVNQNEAATFSVFPNPVTNGTVNIKINNNEAVNVSVFDVLGKQVLVKNVTNQTLNVSSLNAGVYILRIAQNGNSTTKKLVIK